MKIGRPLGPQPRKERRFGLSLAAAVGHGTSRQDEHAALPVAAFFTSSAEVCDALETVLGSGLTVAALEYLDEGTLSATAGAFPGPVPAAARFMLRPNMASRETWGTLYFVAARTRLIEARLQRDCRS